MTTGESDGFGEKKIGAPKHAALRRGAVPRRPPLPPPQLQAASARSPSRVHGRALAGLLGGWSLLWNNITGPAMVALGGVYLNAGWRAPAYGQTKERWKRENAP